MVVGISATGWGGVNSHIVLCSPPGGRLKKTTICYGRSRRNAQLLQAPRKGNVTAAGTNGVELSIIDTLAACVALCALRLLEKDVNTESDLRADGIDSLAYMRLVNRMRELLGPPGIG